MEKLSYITMAEVDWSAVNDKLPYKKDAEEFSKRKDLWKRCDVNGNGIMSLAEIDKAVRDVLGLDEVFDAKPAIIGRAQSSHQGDQSAISSSPKTIFFERIWGQKGP